MSKIVEVGYTKIILIKLAFNLQYIFYNFCFMFRIIVAIALLLLTGCYSSEETKELSAKKILPKELKEISGMSAQGNNIWTITDKPKPFIYNLDSLGNLVQTVEITNVKVVDVEAVTSDEQYVYMCDAGDNVGDRIERQIIRVPINAIGKDKNVKAPGETITFIFPGDSAVAKKKKNNYDCESLLSFKDSLYVFTKDREEGQTKLFSLPKTPGNYTATFIDSFDYKGLITDAAINQSNTEVALTGYHKGHKYPFIFLFKNFTGNDFFTGKHERVELADKPWDWQLESITYKRDDMIFFACEGTKQVDATFYAIKRDKLKKLDKKKADKKNKEEDEGKPLTTRGKLKY